MTRFIVVSGLPASGKTTLGRRIAEELRLPMFDKDEILERLFETLGVGDVVWRRKLSRMADDELRRQASASSGALITSWWQHPLSEVESGTPIDWLRDLRGEVLELHCVCSPALAANRFIARKRHHGHLDGRHTYAALLASFEMQHSFGPLGLGRVVTADTQAEPPLAAILSQVG